MNKDFYSFTMKMQFNSFKSWLQSLGEVNRLERVGFDKQGHTLYGLFFDRQKRGLVRIPKELLESNEQAMIDAVREVFSKHHKVKVKLKLPGEYNAFP